MHARVNSAQWDPTKIDAGMKLTDEIIIPSYQAQPGFRGYLLLTTPAGDRAMAITLWETKEDMEASAAVAKAMIPKLREILRERPVTETFEVRVSVFQ